MLEIIDVNRAQRFLASGLLLGLLGCGVQDYEARMIQSQKLMERWELEARSLGPPLSVPLRMDSDDKPISTLMIFLRPPKGIASSPENPKEPRARMMYTYKPQGSAGPFVVVEIAQGDKSSSFETDVMQCYHGSNSKTTKREIRPPGRSPIPFKTVEFEDGNVFYSVNLWRGPQGQVAIVYGVNAAQRASAARVIDLSLETFSHGVEAGKLRDFTVKGPFVVPGHPQ